MAKQVKSFALPSQEQEANEFLAKNPPESVASFSDRIVINYDDVSYPDAYKEEEIKALMLSNTKQIMTTGISTRTSEIDLARFEAELESLRATSVTSGGKVKYQDERDREAKITAYEERANNIKKAMKELAEAVIRLDTRNFVMQEMLDNLKNK